MIQALRVRRAENFGERLRRDFSLLINLIDNGLLGYFLFWLNIPFVLSAETVTDAVLNSLAIVFLLEIDDRIRPLQPTQRFGLDIIDWDNDHATANIIKLAHDYLYFKRDNRMPDHVEVTKIFKTFEETRDEELRHTFSPRDYCRIYVDDWDDDAKEHRITVFRLTNEQMFPPVYEEFIYKVKGPGAKEFISNVQNFRRVHRDGSDSLNEYSRKRALRQFGHIRSKTSLEQMEVSRKSNCAEYLNAMEENNDDHDASRDDEEPSFFLSQKQRHSGRSSRSSGILGEKAAAMLKRQNEKKLQEI